MNNALGHIAVINLTRMGDLLMTGPMIRRLRRAHPGCEIHLIAVPSYLPIARGMKVDRIIPFEFSRFTEIAIRAANSGFRESLADLLREFRDALRPLLAVRYDAIYNVSHTEISQLFAFLLNGPVRGGMSLDHEGYRIIVGAWARYFFAGNLNRELNPFHLADVMLGTVDMPGTGEAEAEVEYNIPDEARKRVSALAKKMGLERETGPRIAVQCGASTDDKRWEPERFGATAEILRKRLGAHVLFVGTEEERAFAVTAAERMKDGAYILAGRTNLSELAAWLESADLLISNDTGTMHLAQAVGTRSLVITLGAALSDETGPYGADNLILEPDISCFPCSFHVECPHFNCHTFVKPEIAAELAVEMLRGPVKSLPDSLRSSDLQCSIWKTGFDGDGFWRKFPLTAVRPKPSRIYHELFRELWKARFEPSLRPRGESAETVVNALEQALGAFPENVAPAMVERDLPGTRNIIAFAREGRTLALELARLAENRNSPLESIRETGDRLLELDRRIAKECIANLALRPLLIMFQFGKENLSPGNLASQANETADVYDDLAKNAGMAARLMTDVFSLWRERSALASESPAHHQEEQQGVRISDGGRSGNVDQKGSKSLTANMSALVRPRMKRAPYHIIVPVNDYFIQTEMVTAFRRQGHRVTELRFEGNPVFLENLLEASLSADLLFTINHLGFDREGALASILEGIELPYVSWYVDRPGFILLDYPAAPSELAFIYSWEPAAVDEIRAYGFPRVEFLPLATDPERFTPGRDEGEGAVRWVANSMLAASSDWRGKAGINGRPDPLFERAVSLQRTGRLDPVEVLNAAARLEGVDLERWPRHARLTYASAVALTATRELRCEIAGVCAPLGLTVYGDEGWLVTTPQVSYGGAVEYPGGLPPLYRGGVHINATSYQMPAGVNQRVFDVPACGGILLTDDQENLFELFEPEKETITFSEPAEAAEKLRWILKNRESAARKSRQARKRILKEHTYDMRALRILNDVKARVGRTVVATQGGGSYA